MRQLGSQNHIWYICDKNHVVTFEPPKQLLNHSSQFWTTAVCSEQLLSVLSHCCQFWTTAVSSEQRLSVLNNGCQFWATAVSSEQRLSVLNNGCQFWTTAVSSEQRLSVLNNCCQFWTTAVSSEPQPQGCISKAVAGLAVPDAVCSLCICWPAFTLPLPSQFVCDSVNIHITRYCGAAFT
jgi:hypothetical protein